MKSPRMDFMRPLGATPLAVPRREAGAVAPATIPASPSIPLRPVDREPPAPYERRDASEVAGLHWGAHVVCWNGRDLLKGNARELTRDREARGVRLRSGALIRFPLPDDPDDAVYSDDRELVIVIWRGSLDANRDDSEITY